MNRWWLIGTVTLLAGCNASEAASTTTSVAIAAPTTTVPLTTALSTTTTTTTTTTVAPTTATPSTAAPTTTAPTDPIEAAKREVSDRYEAFSVTANECVAVGAACDLPTVLGEFSSPEAALYQLYFNRWTDVVKNDQRVEHLDRVARSVASVEVAKDVAVLTACVADASALVDGNGSVVNDRVGYRLEETFWHQEGEEWRLIGGTTYRLDQAGDDICQF